MINIKPLKIVHFAFCLSIIVFAIVIILLNREKINFDFSFSFQEKTIQALSLIGIVVALAMSRLSSYFFNKIITKIDLNDTPINRFKKYQTAFLIKCAMLESSAFLSMILFFLTFNAYFLLFTLFTLLSLWLARPTKEHIYETLKLTDNQF